VSACGYPGIGFDPTPGDPAEVAELQRRLAGAGAWLGDARGLVDRLASAEDQDWQGEAATAFRDHLRDGLAQHLGRAQDALRQAAEQLQDWHTGLLGRQDRARRLDAELQRLRQPLELDPSGTLDAAMDALVLVRQETERLLAEARELEQDHAADAERIAARLHGDWPGGGSPGPGALAGLLAQLSDGVAELGGELYQHAGTISAVSGLLALVPTPLTPLLAGIALASGTTQLGKDVADPALWAALWPPRPGLDTTLAAVTLGGDVAGVVPGLSAVARGASGTVKGLRAATAAGRAVPVETAAGSFLRDTVTVLSRASRADAEVRVRPGMTVDDLAARRRRLLLDRAGAAVGVGGALYDELTGPAPAKGQEAAQ
jgi:hypothetical protein